MNRILVVGAGGREHALAWKLHRDDPSREILITRGNGGTDPVARAVPVDPGDTDGLVRVARAEGVDFTVVGPEAPLAAGLADRFREAGLAVFGPGKAAARLEASKAFSKRLMADAAVPTARFAVFRAREPAAAFARELGIPVVIKASGLAAGKGALVCRATAELEDALDACYVRRDFGAAGDEVVVEEFLEGEEVSIIALTDGETLVPLLPSQDHKAALDGDRGPNTGGMGAYAPVSRMGAGLRARVLDEIFRPVLGALEAEGTPFTGCMYAGLMLTDKGPRVLEWNVRFGDPECQALLPLLESDLLPLLAAATPEGNGPGGRLADLEPAWRDGACVTVVAASEGYPGETAPPQPIAIPGDLAGPDTIDENGVIVFHAATGRVDGELLPTGGRVLNVTAVGDDVEGARETAYAALDRIEAPSLRHRTDIGWRELERGAARASG